MRVSNLVRERLTAKLEALRVVVWYDGERAFGDFIAGFSAPNCTVVAARPSRLQARREADAVYLQLNDPYQPLRHASLLVYLPYPRAHGEARRQDMFEVFAAAGGTFGDGEAEQLQSLAHQALPDFRDQIDRLFAAGDGRPSLALLDRLEHGPAYPLVKQALGTQSAPEVAARLLSDPQAAGELSAVPGATREVSRLLADELGFAPPAGQPLAAWLDQLGGYILFSELVFDLPAPLPDALGQVPRAAARYRDAVYATCDRLRDSFAARDAYVQLATQVEARLRLPDHFVGWTDFGVRDTFAFEERAHLTAVVRALGEGVAPARAALAQRRACIWRDQPERAQGWRVVERALDLLETAEGMASLSANDTASLSAMVTAYTREGGWSELDLRQRLLEQSLAEGGDAEALTGIVVQARRGYREAIDRVQRRFLDLVARQGWPPEVALRQTQVFDRLVAPSLANREPVALLLVDALRFEMGRALAERLTKLGEVRAQAVAASLPTVTPVGMASLLPGADGHLTLRGDEATPYLGERRVKDRAERLALLRERYGDRLRDMELTDVLSLPLDAKGQARLGNADLLVVLTRDIDELGEGSNPYQARKRMTELLGDLISAIERLVRLGYPYIVVATDHGHVLLPDVAGDTAKAPPGEWALKKRRSLLGRRISEAPGTRAFAASHVGIQGDARDYVVPSGFGVYEQGTGYFHEGLSLQEAVIPVITLRAAPPAASLGGQTFSIDHRSGKFTSRVISLKIRYNSLLVPTAHVRVEAFDATSPKDRVGEAADCEARDEVSHEITLQAGQETQVPILLDAAFDGPAIEVRVSDPATQVVHARLTLKNAMLE